MGALLERERESDGRQDRKLAKVSHSALPPSCHSRYEMEMMRMKASGGISEEATHIDRHKDIAPFEEAMIDRKWKKKGTGAGERLEKGVGKW